MKNIHAKSKFCICLLVTLGHKSAHQIFPMDRITPNQYIRLNKKICKPDVVITVHQLAYEWGITPEDACYRILSESVMRETIKRKIENAK